MVFLCQILKNTLMKKHLLFIVTFFLFSLLSYGQDITDGLRYSTDISQGTARYSALSGAFGALGGDLSAIANNPAGSAVFLENTASVSLSFDHKDNTSDYFNTRTNTTDNDVSINQGGAVLVFDLQHNTASQWKKITLGLNYNSTNNLDNNIFIAGNGNQSIGSFFLNQAQGIELELLELRIDQGETISDLYSFLGSTEGVQAQQAFLGYQAFLYDPVSNELNNTQYSPNYGSGNFDQEYYAASRGYNGKLTFNLGAQYGDNLFLGLNLNSHTIDYDQSTFISELNTNGNSTIKLIEFENNLATVGAGFSAQIGAISKIANNLRVGLTYDTPTWYVISEETTQSLYTERSIDNQNITAFIDPQIINVFEDYNLKTPGRLGASAAYIFGKQGLISFDYSYKDYSNITFSPKNNTTFSNENELIGNTLKGASTYRVGAEYRIQELSLRGGFNLEESPFKNENTLGDRQGYSLGLGYNFGNYQFDIAYSETQQNSQEPLYNTGLTSAPTIDEKQSNLLFTLTLNL